MGIFVIVRQRGEYSDREVSMVGYTDDEEKAKRYVVEFTRRDQREADRQAAETKLYWAFVEPWKLENPIPQFFEQRPKFDHNRARDKEYVAEHTKLKHEWNRKFDAWRRGPLMDYTNAMSKAADEYIAANFDPDAEHPTVFNDTRYHYEIIEFLE